MIHLEGVPAAGGHYRPSVLAPTQRPLPAIQCHHLRAPAPPLVRALVPPRQQDGVSGLGAPGAPAAVGLPQERVGLPALEVSRVRSGS